MLGVVVVGVFIALNHQTSRWGGLLSMGAPDTVRCASHVTQLLGFRSCRPLEALSSGGTGQSGATPDRHYSLFGVPLSLRSDSAAHYSSVLQLLQSTIAQSSYCSAGAPDSPVNYSGVRLKKPKIGSLDSVRSWCTGHCPVAHRTVRCARPNHTRFLCSFEYDP
jgi:hypothetical protein